MILDVVKVPVMDQQQFDPSSIEGQANAIV
jgi:hypothetical protein